MIKARKKLFNNVRPGKGSIKYQKPSEAGHKKKELAEAKRLLAEYGGDYIILSEPSGDNVKRPDIKRDNVALIEEKTFSSLESLDKRLRVGIRQLLYAENRIAGIKQRVVILNSRTKDERLSSKEIRDVVSHRISLSKQTEVTAVIVRNGSKTIEIAF